MDPVLVAENGYGAQPHLVRVSEDQIGIRYSLLLRDKDGKYNEVSPTAVFHSGDDLKLSIMANQPGYLYVIQQGSSGKWAPLFPPAGSSAESNKVEQGQLTQIPGGKGAFEFNTQPGEERLFIVLSRRPIENLQNTIEGLKKPGDASNPQQPAPAPDMRTYEASNDVPAELQRFASRDLNLVQVEDAKDTSGSSGTAEKAVYVVSKGNATSSGPQVVASLTLRHE